MFMTEDQKKYYAAMKKMGKKKRGRPAGAGRMAP